MAVKADKRKGVKPTQAQAKSVKALFGQYTTRELSVRLGIDYITLKKIERRENVMAHKLAQLDEAIISLTLLA